jgi:hypothetical protein
MPFVESGVAHRDYQGNQGPLHSPAEALAPNPVEHSDAENTEFSDMGQFSNSSMNQAKSVRACGRKEPSQEWNQESGSLCTAKVVGREGRNEHSYANGWNPVFEAVSHIELSAERVRNP